LLTTRTTSQRAFPIRQVDFHLFFLRVPPLRRFRFLEWCLRPFSALFNINLTSLPSHNRPLPIGCQLTSRLFSSPFLHFRLVFALRVFEGDFLVTSNVAFLFIRESIGDHLLFLSWCVSALFSPIFFLYFSLQTFAHLLLGSPNALPSRHYPAAGLKVFFFYLSSKTRDFNSVISCFFRLLLLLFPPTFLGKL